MHKHNGVTPLLKLSRKGPDGSLPDESDFAKANDALLAECQTLETTLRVSGQTVPPRPRPDASDVIEAHEAMHAHVCCLRALVSKTTTAPTASTDTAIAASIRNLEAQCAAVADALRSKGVNVPAAPVKGADLQAYNTQLQAHASALLALANGKTNNVKLNATQRALAAKGKSAPTAPQQTFTGATAKILKAEGVSNLEELSAKRATQTWRINQK